MPHCTQLDRERIATSTRESKPGVLVVSKHHLLVRCSHWLNVPILLGLRAAAATSRAGQDLIATLPPYPELQRPRLLINLKPVHAVPRSVQNLGEFPFRQPCESSSPVHIPAQGRISLGANVRQCATAGEHIGSNRIQVLRTPVKFIKSANPVSTSGITNTLALGCINFDGLEVSFA